MSEVNKIANYNQMMSWLTRPSVPKTETRENLKYGSVPGEGNSRIEYDSETDTYRKKVQETIDSKKTNKYIYSKPGDSLEDLKKIKPVRSTGADDATVKARQYIDGWTKNWFDNNLKNYGVNSFDVMIDELSSAWQLQLESGDVPKASGKFNLSTPKLKLPNITSGRDAKQKMKKGTIEPFNYNNVKFYANLEGSKEELNKTLSQYKKVFYKNKIETNPQLRSGLKNFFDFMSSNKQGLYLKLEGKTIKDFMNTEVSDEVKFLLDPDISGLGKTSKNEVFNSYSDLADNYNKFTEDKVRLKAVQAETEAVAKAGKKTAEQYKKVKADIAKQNDVLAKMSVKEIANDKKLLNSVRMSINPKTGEVSYTNYTVNDPKKKTALTDLELAEKIKQKAKNKNFYVTEHIGKKSFNKANLAFPNNIQSANYMSNAQLENARRFLIIPENRNTPAAQNLDKALEDLKLTIRGPEYGNKPIGNKIKIKVDSKTGVSNIVQDQSINNKTAVVNNLTETIPGVTTADKLNKPPATLEREMFEKANNNLSPETVKKDLTNVQKVFRKIKGQLNSGMDPKLLAEYIGAEVKDLSAFGSKYGGKVLSKVGRGITGIDLPIFQVMFASMYDLEQDSPVWLTLPAAFTDEVSNIFKLYDKSTGKYGLGKAKDFGKFLASSLVPQKILGRAFRNPLFKAATKVGRIGSFAAPVLELGKQAYLSEKRKGMLPDIARQFDIPIEEAKKSYDNFVKQSQIRGMQSMVDDTEIPEMSQQGKNNLNSKINSFKEFGSLFGFNENPLAEKESIYTRGKENPMSLDRVLYPDRQNFAKGGRVNFADGPKDPSKKGIGSLSKRNFLKMLTLIPAGILAIRGGPNVLNKVKKTTTAVKESFDGAPAHFINLYNKIKNLGKDITEKAATKDGDIVTKFKDYELTEDLATGEKTIQRMKVLDDDSASYYGNPLTEETYMSYKPGKGQMDETMEGKTPPNEYEEGTALLRSDREFAGDVVDESTEISDEVIKEGTMFEDDFLDFQPNKKK